MAGLRPENGPVCACVRARPRFVCWINFQRVTEKEKKRRSACERDGARMREQESKRARERKRESNTEKRAHTHSVVNVGQILGDKVFVSVEGAVSEQSTSDRTPKFYTADIDQGALNVLGLRIPLPIKGRGVAKLLYHDANLRIFESPKESESEWEQEGLVVVQMPLWKKF